MGFNSSLIQLISTENEPLSVTVSMSNPVYSISSCDLFPWGFAARPKWEVYDLPIGCPVLPLMLDDSCLLINTIRFSLGQTMNEPSQEFREIFVNQELPGAIGFASSGGVESWLFLNGVAATFSCNGRPAILSICISYEEWTLLGPSLVSHWVWVKIYKMWMSS